MNGLILFSGLWEDRLDRFEEYMLDPKRKEQT
ncbi:hypothetical protein SAMN04488601_1011713 [Paenibacillus sp. 453mf]|nr:hypothetical protein SAMN04488601_1011713 [Paenibacillus sp. 453mf]